MTSFRSFLSIDFISTTSILVILFAAFAALTGCTTIRQVETPLADRVPASLLACRDRPVPGSLDRQSDVARYVVDLDAAGQDCRSQVEAVREIAEGDGTPGG